MDLLFVVLLVLGFVSLKLLLNLNFAEVYILALCGLVAYSIVIAETLSIFGEFSRSWVQGLVTVVLILPIVGLVRTGKLSSKMFAVLLRSQARSLKSNWLYWVYFVLAVASSTLIAPTNFDSQTYHLPRIEHWLQDGRISVFETTNDREALYNAAPEIFQSLFLAFAPTGRLVGLAAVMSLGAICCAIWLLFSLFENNAVPTYKPALYANVFVLSIPLVVTMSSTTQVDLLSLLPLCLLSVISRRVQLGDIKHVPALIAVALSLAVALKFTALLAVLVPSVFLFWSIPAKRKSAVTLRSLVLTFIFGVFIYGGQFIRSLGNSGPSTTGMIAWPPNRITIVGNPIKNFALWFQTPFEPLNDFVNSITRGILSSTDLDSETDGVNILGITRFEIFGGWQDSHLGAPLHLLVVMFAVLIALWKKYVRSAGISDEVSMGLKLASIGMLSALLISITLKWHPWMNRFTLCAVILCAPLVGALIEESKEVIKKTFFQLAFGFSMLLLAIAPERGLLGPGFIWQISGIASFGKEASLLPLDWEQQIGGYSGTWLNDEYRAAMEFVAESGRTDVVLEVGSNAPEYMAWYQKVNHFNYLNLRHGKPDPDNSILLCWQNCASKAEILKSFAGDALIVALPRH